MIHESEMREYLVGEAKRIVRSLGQGDISESAYDTAWVARIRHADQPTQPQFPQSYDWLLTHQHPDGSWGGEIPFAHDRLVSTLAAILALAQGEYRRGESDLAIRRAVVYLNRDLPSVELDPAETVGFELLLPELLSEAKAFGLRLPYQNWAFVERIQAEKLSRIPPLAIYSGPSPLTHSIEFLGDRFLPVLVARCQFDNGSYGISPSSTAYVHNRMPAEGTARYLRRVQAVYDTGGVPYVHPFEMFETSWVLQILGPWITPAEDGGRSIERLQAGWTPLGAAWTMESTVTDADDTAVVSLALMTVGHQQIDPGVLALYETPECFRTFIYERNASVTTNAHVLSALRLLPSTMEARRMILKTVRYLEENQATGPYWEDKWHASPYYATNEAVAALAGLSGRAVRGATDWILSEQHENGAWGFTGGTQEETAWALHALATTVEKDPSMRVNAEPAIRRGVAYLQERLEDRSYPALWIGKSLYSPPNIVRAAIVSALLRAIMLVGYGAE